MRESFGMLVACGLLAGCLAAPPSGPDVEEAPLLQAAGQAPPATRTTARLCGMYLGEPRGAVDVGLQIVFPGAEDIIQNDPDSPRYNEVWDTSIGLAAHTRGIIGMATDFHYYAGMTLAFMKGKDYDLFGIDFSLSDELMITLTGGVQYRKKLEQIEPYGRAGVGLLFWPSTKLETRFGNADIFDSSTNFILELGGGVAVAFDFGKLFVEICFTFGPEPDLASGLSGDAGKYNPFTITIGGALRM